MSDIIELRHITKTYQQGGNSFSALKNISLTIKEGEFVALMGPSGSGKSTLLNICGLLDDDYAGEYLLDNQSIRNNERKATRIRREKLGFIFQNFNLLPVLSVYENIEYPLILNSVSSKERKALTSDLIEQIGLSQHAHRRPEMLSGGQQQRAAIARALVTSPRLVIADEPTANLDAKTASDVLSLMKSLGKSRNTTFVIATHDKRISKYFDWVITVSDGEIIDKEAI